MDNKTRDVRYLTEYYQFTGYGPTFVGQALYQRYRQAIAERRYDCAAHVLAHLYGQMVIAMESAASLFLAYSRWDTAAGVLGTLTSYRHAELYKFLGELLNSSFPTEILKLPTPESLRRIADDPAGIDSIYNEKAVAKIVSDTCRMFIDEDVRKVSNRTKHGMVYSRHLAFLETDRSVPEPTSSIKFIHPTKSLTVFDVTNLEVMGARGLRTATTLHRNTEVVAKHNRDLAGFVATAIEHDIMRK